MVDDSLPHPSVNIHELNSGHKLDNPMDMDVDQPKEDLKIFPEDLYDSECHNKYVDLLPTEVNDDFVSKDSSDKDCITEVKGAPADSGFDSLAEPSATCLSETRVDEDIKVQFTADTNSLKFEHSSLQKRCRETDGNDVKDICIDEGIPSKEKTYVEDVFEGPKHIVDDIYYPVKDGEFGSNNKVVDTECQIPVDLKSSTDVVCVKDLNSCESKVLIHQSGSENEAKCMLLRDLKEKVVETLLIPNTAADDSQLKATVGDGCKTEHDIVQRGTLTEHEVAAGKLRSSSPTSEETADGNEMEALLMKTEPVKELTNKSPHPTTINQPQLLDGAHLPHRLDPFILSSAPLQRDHFESSFASVGQYTGSITYSGPIAHSGSLSHRSDASTASTRSFAFPVLQNEWNFSPVRMQKADRRHLRRHKGWMHDLFCCKF